MSVPSPLDKILEAYCHVNATNLEMLAEHCKRSDWSYCQPEQYKQQLKFVIENRTISISEYDAITQEEFDSIEDLYAWLVEVWQYTVGEPFDLQNG